MATEKSATEIKIETLASALEGVDGPVVDALIKLMPRKIVAGAAGAAGVEGKEFFIVDKRYEAKIRAAFRMARRGRTKPHMRLYGPTGSGKTSLAFFMAHNQGLKIERVPCTEGMGLDELLGSLSQDPTTKTWVAQWKPLVTAAIEGHPVLLDEWNKLSESAMEVLLAFMDDRPEVTVSISGAKISIVKAPGFFVVCTSNDRGDGSSSAFGNSKRVNSAVLNRFGSTLYIDYLPPEQEVDAVIGKSGLSDRALVEKMVGVASRSRTPAAVDEGWQPVSTRDLIGWAEQILLAREDKDGELTIVELGEMAFQESASFEYRESLHRAMKDAFGSTRPCTSSR
jgi:MoxR-like ATPase